MLEPFRTKAEEERPSVKSRETAFLPPPRVIKEQEEEEPGPLPGEPPKIWGATEDPINKPCAKPVRSAIETSRLFLRPFESDEVKGALA